MNEHQRPIFWFLWPRPDPQAPLDGNAQQRRLVRVTPRGPLRLIALVAASILTVGLLATAILAVTDAGLTLGSLVGAALAATAVALTLRGWVVGTYVNDHGVVIDSTFRRTRTPWSAVVTTSLVVTAVPVLGLPARAGGQRVFIECVDGSRLATHVYSASPDLCCRPEAFDMARIRLDNWREQR